MKYKIQRSPTLRNCANGNCNGSAHSAGYVSVCVMLMHYD